MLNNDFENTLTSLLMDVAEQVSSKRDVVSYVGQTLSTQDDERIHHSLPISQSDHIVPTGAAHTKPSVSRFTSRFIAFMSAATLVALFTGLFIWIHPHVLQKPPVSPAITTKAFTRCPVLPITPGNSYTQQGVTVHVSQLYADVSRTAVDFHVIDTTGKQTYIPKDFYLEDGCGQKYLLPGGMGASSTRGDTDFRQEFAPLPESDAGFTETLALVVDNIRDSSLAPNPLSNTISGEWKVVMNVHIGQGQVLPITTAAQTHDGITIQIKYANWTQTSPQFDGFTGGIRVRLHLSGLPLPTFYESFHFDYGNSQGSADGGGLAQLTLLDGQQLSPGLIFPTDVRTPQASTTSSSQFVTSTGEADLDVIYLTTVPTHGSISTLTLDKVNVTYILTNPTQGLETDGKQYIFRGPWNFQFPNQ